MPTPGLGATTALGAERIATTAKSALQAIREGDRGGAAANPDIREKEE